MNIAPIRRSVVVKLPPARAFDVFTKDIGRWWPKHMALGSSPVATVILESRVGGRWFQRAQDGVETDWGDVLAWEPPRRLLLAWRIDASFKYDPVLLTEVEITFTPENGGTRVLLEHRKLEALGDGAERAAGELDAGWPTPLRHLADYIDAELGNAEPPHD